VWDCVFARKRILPVRPEKSARSLRHLEGIGRPQEDGWRQSAKLVRRVLANMDGPDGLPFGRLEFFLVIAVLCPMCTEDLVGGYGMRRHRPGDPGQI
jgi:hypothetical protein